MEGKMQSESDLGDLGWQTCTVVTWSWRMHIHDQFQNSNKNTEQVINSDISARATCVERVIKGATITIHTCCIGQHWCWTPTATEDPPPSVQRKLLGKCLLNAENCKLLAASIPPISDSCCFDSANGVSAAAAAAAAAARTWSFPWWSKWCL